jgi:hypothetical protein
MDIFFHSKKIMRIQKEEDEDSSKMMNMFIIFPIFFYFQQKYILKNKLI